MESKQKPFIVMSYKLWILTFILAKSFIIDTLPLSINKAKCWSFTVTFAMKCGTWVYSSRNHSVKILAFKSIASKINSTISSNSNAIYQSIVHISKESSLNNNLARKVSFASFYYKQTANGEKRSLHCPRRKRTSTFWTEPSLSQLWNNLNRFLSACEVSNFIMPFQ